MSLELEKLQDRYPGSKTFRFGDGPELSGLLLGLVRDGKKTATSMSLDDVTNGHEAMPEVGRKDIALNWDGSPAIVLETTHVELVRFDEVSVEFALAEGENETLAGWREDHQEYFERNGGFDPKMVLVCERFRVVENCA